MRISRECFFGSNLHKNWIVGSEFPKSKSGFEISSSKIASAPIFRQNGQFWLLSPNLPKNEFCDRNFKNLSLDSESAPPKYHVYQLSDICPKTDLGLEIQKTNVGIRISILKIQCVLIFRQNRQLKIFWLKLAQKWI